MEDKYVSLFIPLSSCPIVRMKDIDDFTTRLTCDNCQILKVFAQHPVLAVTLPYTASNWIQLWSTLHSSSLFPVPLFDSKIQIMETNFFNPFIPPLVDSNYCDRKQTEDCLWLLSVLKCTRSVCLTRHTIDMIFLFISQSNSLQNLLAISASLSKLITLCSTATTNYFFDILGYFNTEMESIQGLELQVIQPPINYRSIEYAMVTPSTVICHTPITVQCSRLYRNFPDVRFLLVAFRDEQNQILHNRDVLGRVREVLVEGFEINGDRFYFLLSSPSQLREHRAVFIQILDRDSPVCVLNEIRRKILGTTVIRDEIKFLSRLGLFSTSDIPMLQIPQSSVGEINDIRADNNQLLTDGSGKICYNLSHEISAKLGFTFQRNLSALQIRLAGYKGVLTVANRDDPDFSSINLRKYKILVRPSMKKMEWTDSSLNIVSLPTYEPFFINLSFINLISSLSDPLSQWNPEPVIRELHTKALMDYGQILADTKLANQSLSMHLLNYSMNISEYFDVRTEPYFLSLLRCIYRFNVNNLVTKARIPLDNGGLFMGIPDPIGVLDDGEIFIQYERDGESNTQIIEGPVILYKHPCLHPGDLLCPIAVEKRELIHLKNVIVFPIRGRISLPASTSGGDLDGDLFAVIWESGLIPPQYSLHPALNYEEIAEKGHALQLTLQEQKIPLLEDNDNTQQRLSTAYCRVISNDSLGKIANLHLALCDQLEDGACNPLAISVAESQSIAVDYPKTGVAPVIPQEAVGMLRDKGFPDFMEKDGAQSYPSTKLLGELYRSAKSVCYAGEENPSHIHSTVDINRNPLHDISTHYLYVPGSECYIDEARATYSIYANAMQQIMTSFGLETEAETVLGLIIKCHPMLSADKRKTKKALNAVIQALFEQFRDIFFQGISTRDSIECSKKVFAWYYITHAQSYDTMVFYSFPWIMNEYLCNISSKKRRFESESNAILGRTAREYLSKNSDYIRTNVESKLSTFPMVESSIRNYIASTITNNPYSVPIFNITCFGSVSLFLCEPQSDLDISVNPTPLCYNYIFPSPADRQEFELLNIHKQIKHILMTLVSPAIDSISHSKMEKYTAQVPIIAITVDSPLDANNQVDIDITIGSDGVQKCEYIMQLYCETGGVFYGWLWILVHWARHVGILKCQTSVENTGIIVTAEFEALALYIYDKMSNKSQDNCIQMSELSCSFLLDKLMRSDIDSILGSMLVEFFWLGMKLTSKQDSIVYEWPIEGKPTHTIDGTNLKKISFLLFQAWHCIVYTRDLAKIFERNDIPLKLNKRLSYKVSNRIRASCHFHELRLTSLTGAIIHIEDLGRHVLITSQGSASSIHKLSIELAKLEKITSLTKKYAFNANKYILEDSFIIIFVNQSYNIRVKLFPFTSACFKLYDTHNERSHVVYACETVDTAWKQQAISRLQFLLLDQLAKFPVTNKKLLGRLRFKTRFGFFYVLGSNDSFQLYGNCMYLQDFEHYLKKSLRYRRQIFREFLPIKTTDDNENSLDKKTTLSSFRNSEETLRETVEKKRKNYPSCSFCPGLQEITNSNDYNVCQSIYTTALEQCGFITCEQSKSYTWMMDIRVTKSFDIRIKLDDRMNIFAINERPLVWMVATIIADRNVADKDDKLHDIRLRMDTTEDVDPGSNLYKFVFPNGIKGPLLTVGLDGIPIPCGDLKGRLKIIRHKVRYIYYKRGSVIAKITIGTEYSGKMSQFGRKFCELSLLNNEHELRQAVAGGNNSNDILRIAENAVNISLEISKALVANQSHL